jgi:hypothetical protein
MFHYLIIFRITFNTFNIVKTNLLFLFLNIPYRDMDNSDESKSFFKHVFNFDDDSKSEILNILQYSLVALIPIVILNKTMQRYVPEADDKKSSLEISAEILIQVIVMFIGLLIIHRIITFIPTYSGVKYPEFHIVYIILAILMITLSLQTKLGEKVSILVDRLSELWDGKPDTKKKAGKNGAVKVSQPIAGQQQQQMGGYTDGTSISSLPNMNTVQPPQNTMQPQQLPNYDAMYRQDTTPLVGASTPGLQEGFNEPMEPMAANAVLGGSGSWGSW